MNEIQIQTHLDIEDTLIIYNLISNKYDIKELKTNFIIYCILLINIQVESFNMLFEGDDMCSELSYYDDSEFKNNENDLLKIGNMVKILHPFLNELRNEIKENRQMNAEEILKKHRESIQDYAIKNNVLLLYKPLNLDL
jgi:hypothetical protein